MAQAIQLPSLGMARPTHREEEPNRRQWSPVKSMESPVWLREAYDRISALAALKNNWDTYGGLPVASRAILGARVLLSNLDLEGFPKPHLAPIPDGGIGLHWRILGRDLEIEVEASGVVRYLKTHVGGESTDGEVRSLQDAQEALNWVLGT